MEVQAHTHTARKKMDTLCTEERESKVGSRKENNSYGKDNNTKDRRVSIGLFSINGFQSVK